ncbi:MAG: CsbD family protein [Candidatus Hydrogenedentes bacterium]|nr:CsbD family protein [Candidatus Hydrogenedentota bacterium]
MSWDKVEGSWKQLKGDVKERWGKLTDDDVSEVNGKRDQLAGKLQERYGYAKDRVEQELTDFINGLRS